MSKRYQARFNIYISDGFERAVREYFGDIEEDVTDSDILHYLEQKIRPASSGAPDVFEVEGGDTDGWFIQGLEEYD